MAWDFAAEIHSLANYNADDASTTGTSGEVLSAHATQWLTDGAKEIINQLPAKLKAKCSTISIINATNGTTLDLDDKGDILNVTRLSANSGGYYKPCREIPAQYGDLANDSTDLNYYATASDPVYYITSNSSDVATLFVKPTTTDAQPANAYHITYPTVAFNSTAIANFPDEAEYLVVLYAATKACLYQMNTLQTDTTIDTTALGAIATELNKADDIINTAHTQVGNYYTEIATLENTDLWDDTNKRFDIVKNALGNAQDLINNDQPSATTDAYGALAAEDTEIVTSTLQVLQMEINRASAGASEISALMAKHSLPLAGVPQYMSTASGYISQAAGYVGEVQSRMGRANQKYTWYDAQYAKLSAEYARGLAALKGA
jgi:hypothetical protein